MVEVVDGDTMKVSIDGAVTTLRLIGIDTPETQDPRRPVECFGQEATLRAADLASGEDVRLTFDPSQGRLDRYNRTLAYVWLPDGRLFQWAMSDVSASGSGAADGDRLRLHPELVREEAAPTSKGEGRRDEVQAAV